MPSSAEHQALCVEALRLRIDEGLTYRALGERLGISYETARQRCFNAIKEERSPLVEELRAIQDVEIDAARAEVMKILVSETDSDIRIRAVDKLIKLMDRQAKLHGLDAPVRADINVTQETALEKELRELAEEQDRINERRLAELEAGINNG